MLLQFTIFFLLLIRLAMTFSLQNFLEKPNYQTMENSKNYRGDITVIPFHVVLFYDNLFCSGSLVGSRMVITAASCFVKYRNITTVYVKYGSDSMITATNIVKAKEVKLHEFYQRLSRLDNDIAMVFMEKHVNFGPTSMKVMLNEPNVAIPINTWVLVSGWGHLNVPPALENSLIWSEMQVTSDFECAEAYGRLKTPSNFCVRYPPERHLSDNGGPAVHKNLLVGILSYGATGAQEPYIALVTNVSYFNTWIVKNTKHFLEKYCENNFITYYPMKRGIDSSGE